MKPTPITISISVKGPVLVQSSASSVFGVDSAVARYPAGPQKDLPYLPFSLVKGKLKDAWRELGYVDPQNFTESDCIRLFGKGGNSKYKRKQNAEEAASELDAVFAGCLLLNDLIAEGAGSTAVRSNTKVDRDTGAAADQTLRVTETPYLTGESIGFHGTAWLFLPENEAEKLLPALKKALIWLLQVGAFRGIGFGQVETCNLVSAESSRIIPKPDESATHFELVLEVLNPLCISAHHVGENFFESENIIPGNMIAGALMQTRRALGKKNVPKGFDDIRFGHATPCAPEQKSALVPPLSLVTTCKGIRDAVKCKHPVLDAQGCAPAFMTDWKSLDRLHADYRKPCPVHETRVRTAIDPAARTAEDEKLFALEMVYPWQRSKNPDEEDTPLVWKSTLDISQVSEEDRASLIQAISDALHVLGFVSKTKAVCRGTLTASEKPVCPRFQEGESVMLALQTPAQLADPRFQMDVEVPRFGAVEAEDMLACYQATFFELSDNSLELSHAFANQRMTGGNTLAHRFGKTMNYNPWLLTTEGSVFVFKVLDPEKAKKRMEDWLCIGIPLPNWVKQTFGDTWLRNPYLPQNGFGHVVNHKTLHEDLKLDPAITEIPI